MTERTGSTLTDFQNNPLALEAGLQAEEYGKTPAEIMHATELTPAERFWLNAQVRAATSKFKKKRHEEQRDGATSAGAADRQQKKELQKRQSDRADTRESMMDAGMNAPTPDGQLSTLSQVQNEEDRSESLLDGSDGSDGGGRF